MAEIKNIETLEAEIARLKSEISLKERGIREHIASIGDSLKPANLVSSGIKRMMGETEDSSSKSFMKEVAKTGIFLLMRRVFYKPGDKGEERISNFVDMAFDKIKNFTERKRKKKKENTFYKFKDDIDSESK